MNKFFNPNLESKGRVVRGLTSIIFFTGALLVFPSCYPLAVLLLMGGLFVLFEAIRGWCVLRACGIRTKL
ncbi:MAG: DUF2892 domain-containing protein [Verrucomicrobia bacterium]|nr:DUF2892 domain-containing protein [Verrucomicrobiota bacterium]